MRTLSATFCINTFSMIHTDVVGNDKSVWMRSSPHQLTGQPAPHFEVGVPSNDARDASGAGRTAAGVPGLHHLAALRHELPVGLINAWHREGPGIAPSAVLDRLREGIRHDARLSAVGPCFPFSATTGSSFPTSVEVGNPCINIVDIER